MFVYVHKNILISTNLSFINAVDYSYFDQNMSAGLEKCFISGRATWKYAKFATTYIYVCLCTKR